MNVAPSLFQKAMTKIFKPILENTLVYIDDILISSQKILPLIKNCWIDSQPAWDHALRKSHIVQELLNFPDKDLTGKQIQQFLGMVDYIKDFIPKSAQYTNSLSKLLKKNSSP